MNNGIEFPGEGPMMEGIWQNVQTGDYFEVRDTYFQDGQLVVQAKDGRVFDYNTIQNYVKVDKPMQIEKPKKPKKQELPAEVLSEVADDGMLEEDMELLRGGSYAQASSKDYDSSTVSTYNPLEHKQPGSSSQAPAGEDEDMKFIVRALSRVKTEPTFEHKITWKSFPCKQMEMLVDLLGVPVEKVSDYYIDKLSIGDIREILRQSLTDFINHQLDGEAETKTKKTSK